MVETLAEEYRAAFQKHSSGKWSPHTGTPAFSVFDLDGFEQRVVVKCGDAVDAYNRRDVVVALDDEPYVSNFNTCEGHRRRQFAIDAYKYLLPDSLHSDAAEHEWVDLIHRRIMEAADQADGLLDAANEVEKLTFRQLAEGYPELRPPVVDGLFREGETVNFISHAKAGKSWLAYALGLSVVDDHHFLGTFPTACGRVLLVDNELHPETIAYRIPKVADAMGVPHDKWRDSLDVWPLRGRLKSLQDLAREFDDVDRGDYKVIILDAKYRFAVEGVSENDNAGEARFYNTVDQIADKTGAAIVLVHHSSKGSQSDKKVTDVGSGAGAMSRAADCHMVLREHEQDGCAVLDAAVRSFAPPEPLPLRWEFPVWRKADDLDADALRGRKTRQQETREVQDRKDKLSILAAMQDAGERVTNKQLRKLLGMSREKLSRLLDVLESEGAVLSETTTKRGNPCDEYYLPNDSDS